MHKSQLKSIILTSIANDFESINSIVEQMNLEYGSDINEDSIFHTLEYLVRNGLAERYELVSDEYIISTAYDFKKEDSYWWTISDKGIKSL